MHDELVTECDNQDTRQAALSTQNCPIEGMQPLLNVVPVEVNIEIGKTWGGKELTIELFAA